MRVSGWLWEIFAHLEVVAGDKIIGIKDHKVVERLVTRFGIAVL